MESLKPTYFRTGRAGLIASAFLIAPLLADNPAGSPGVSGRELARRALAVEEARELLKKGDEAYLAARYDEAVQAYAGAYEQIPQAPLTAELRSAAADRYALASVELARGLVRHGDLAGAKAAVDKALAEGVAPDHPGARAFRAQLDDPIRTNPALTAEHGRNVDQVRRLLYTAEGAYNLGDFNKSKSHYEEVLRIDPANSAARRGLERVASAKSGYYQSAYDHTRAEMLAQVDAGWETELPAPELDLSLTAPGAGLMDAGFVPIARKLDAIVIPSLQLEQATLDEVLDLLRVRALELDHSETNAARRGVNFVVNLGDATSEAGAEIRNLRFDLRLNNVPLSQILRYVTAQTRTSWTTDDHSVIIRPLSYGTDGMVRRTYRIPPDFISNLSSGAAVGEEADDPFGEPSRTGLLARSLSAQEALVAQSVPFPEGASAHHNKSNNTLIVVNTPLNQDLVEQLIETVGKAEPVLVKVSVTIIRTEQNNLKELGYDWLLSNFSFGADGRYGIGGGTQGSGDAIGDIATASGGVAANPVTAGNRSGTSALNSSSIDNLILESTTGERQGGARGPGIIGANGVLDRGTVQTLLRGLDQKKGTDIMARPSVVTRNGQASSVVLSREFIYPTEYEPPELPNSVGSNFAGGNGAFPVTPATPTAFKKEDVGLTLEVLPVADVDKRYVEVTLNPKVTEFDGFVNYGSPIYSSVQAQGIGGFFSDRTRITDNAILMPVFSKQSVTSNVIMADGATIVIGSLLRNSIENVEDKTPVLGDLPIVGRLFQSKVTRPVATAIIFLVNVELMDPTGRRFNEP